MMIPLFRIQMKKWDRDVGYPLNNSLQKKQYSDKFKSVLLSCFLNKIDLSF